MLSTTERMVLLRRETMSEGVVHLVVVDFFETLELGIRNARKILQDRQCAIQG